MLNDSDKHALASFWTTQELWNAFYVANPLLPGRYVSEDPATFHLQCLHGWKEGFAQNFMIHAPIHHFLHMNQSSCPLCRNPAPKNNLSSPMLDSGHGVLGMQLGILPTPNTESGVYTRVLLRYVMEILKLRIICSVYSGILIVTVCSFFIIW